MDEQPTVVGKAVPLQHVYPDTLATVPAQIMAVQHDEHEFTLAFFDVRAPLLIGDDDDKRRIAESIDHVDAICVARVVIGGGRMRDVVEVLTGNLESWEKKHGGESEGGEDDDDDL